MRPVMRWWWLAVLYAVPAFAQAPEASDLIYSILDLKFVVIDMKGAPKSLETIETRTDTRINLAADVLFDFDKADIRPAGAEALQQVAQMIRQRRSTGVRIEGHTDSKGAMPYNQRLSEARAKAVRDWLQNQDGLSKVRFTVEGFGARRPVTANAWPDGSDNPDGRQKNRRVEIIIGKG